MWLVTLLLLYSLQEGKKIIFEKISHINLLLFKVNEKLHDEAVVHKTFFLILHYHRASTEKKKKKIQRSDCSCSLKSNCMKLLQRIEQNALHLFSIYLVFILFYFICSRALCLSDGADIARIVFALPTPVMNM